MEEENQPSPDPQSQEKTPSSSSNQNLIIGIVMGAVVLLLILLVISQQMGQSGGKPENSELAELRDKIEEERRLNEKLRLSGLPGASLDPEALVSQIKADTEALARLANKSAGDAAMLRTARADASALRRMNEDLRTELEQNRAAAAQVEDLKRQLKQARDSSQRMVSQSQFDQIKSELDLVKANRNRLQDELTDLRGQQQNMVDGNTYALLKSELEELRETNRTLRIENQRLITELNGAKLFVTKEDLSPKAVALYRGLKAIEDEDHRRRREIYDTFAQQLKAEVQESISFKTGSAAIAREHETHLKAVTSDAPANSFFLVVGYASPSGDSQTNEELSSKRATRVASMVNYLKKEGQAVQAVYLGEGTRFGPEDAPNQVCEVWEIQP